ncbi:hypothetical protein BDZ97DRAFT_1902075 [Flammula alnicola]|nr:hypothetical protein BDZ97DRAFT_1902075 [Flammula alnicola]
MQGFFERRCLSTTKCPSSPRMATVHRGNAFEERSLNLLEQTMSMSLKRVGGKEDGGIDLLGWWWLPHETSDASRTSLHPERRRIRVVGQCKAEKKKMGPNYVRELEGVVYRFLTMPSDDTIPPSFPLELSTAPLVALLISQSAFTKSTILRAHSSPIPFFLLHLPPVEDPLLEDSHGHLEVRWERHFLGDGGRPALWWKDEKLRSHIPSIDTPELGRVLDINPQLP